MLNFHLVRYLIGLLVLIGHFFSIGFYLYMVRTIVPEPGTKMYLDGIAAILPFTLLYATVFYRYVVAHPVASEAALNKPMGLAPFLVQFTVVGLFILAIQFVIYDGFQTDSAVGGIEAIPTAIAGIDSVFTVFVSMTFSTLFPLEWEASKVSAKAGKQPT